MEYTRNIVLDVNAISAAAVVKAKQGDNSTRFITVTLTKDGVPVVPEDGATAQFRLHKPDKRAVLNSGTINSDGTITVELTDQCTAVIGRATADISIMKDGKCLSSAIFYLEVIASPDIANRAASSDEFGLLDEAIAKAETAIQDVDDAIEAMQQATSDAIETMQEETQEAIDEMEETMLTAFDKKASVTFSASWSGNDPYTQQVTFTDYTVTPNTRVDLIGTETAVERMQQDNVDRLYIVNDNGVLTAYAHGNMFTQGFTAEAYLHEIINNE